jgi:hypothetical protein
MLFHSTESPKGFLKKKTQCDFCGGSIEGTECLVMTPKFETKGIYCSHKCVLAANEGEHKDV